MPADPVQLLFHLPPLGGDASRLEALLRTLEALLPGAQLCWRLESPAEAEAPDGERWMRGAGVRLVRVPDRTRWLAQQLRQGQELLLYGGAPFEGLSVSVPSGSVSTRGGAAVGSAVVWLAPGTAPAQLLAPLLAAAGDALEAWWAAYMPLAAEAELVQVQRVSPTRRSAGRERLLARTPALAALPRLRAGIPALPTPEAPLSLGWLNYWSAATAHWLGFPDEARDAEWLSRSTRTAAGAWVWRLTEQPFELSRPEHLEALARAYARFERLAAQP